ncbi:hypothetical protein BD626DRAFT_170952 [Schizophyllum amplum]|uniref:Uncharacterized protein n=1 Tax=Schizophyllum amplum TaxID=97359 RepID=A0A550CQZ2_9AGAR|nr:hypothetical protein BD626DRAFT_170952 [Auriculariopsis ampla]
MLRLPCAYSTVLAVPHAHLQHLATRRFGVLLDLQLMIPFVNATPCSFRSSTSQCARCLKTAASAYSRFIREFYARRGRRPQETTSRARRHQENDKYDFSRNRMRCRYACFSVWRGVVSRVMF